MKIEFDGIVSGDYESFCWDVDRDAFVKIKGRQPDVEFEKSYFNDGLFRIYPNDIFRHCGEIPRKFTVEF